jgi:hypothetical protein
MSKTPMKENTFSKDLNKMTYNGLKHPQYRHGGRGVTAHNYNPSTEDTKEDC